MAFGFSSAFNFLILAEALGIDGIKGELEQAVSMYSGADDLKLDAANILSYFEQSLSNKFVIIADRNAEPTAVRFAQQIQENAKLEAFVNVLPENNHNVLESYYSNLPSNVILLNGSSNDRVDLRFDFLKTIFEKNSLPFIHITFDGAVIQEIYKTVHILDWFSILLSNKVGADNMHVPNISELKTYLTTN